MYGHYHKIEIFSVCVVVLVTVNPKTLNNYGLICLELI